MQQLLMTLTMHKAQPWEEALSQAQEDRTVTRPWGRPFPNVLLSLWPWLFL
jgi:ABC-type uncharacterized transport system YnjBCD substrate-binding protein